MAKLKNICHMCGGYGKEGGCPRCGQTPSGVVAVKTLQLDIPIDMIPAAYQGKLWSPPVGDENTPLKFKEFDSNLETVLKIFLDGKIPHFSMFIATPMKYGKHAFAYSCMQTALAQGKTVAPLLTTSDWRRLYKISQMNPFYKLYDAYTWDNLVSRAVVFLSVDHSDDRFDVVGLLKDILDTRAAFNLPTFIISDYKLTELVPKWDAKSYNAIYNPDPKRDYLRYPVILHRFDA